jgi:hypothetical protein
MNSDADTRVAETAVTPAPPDDFSWRRDGLFILAQFAASRALLALVALIGTLLVKTGDYFPGHATVVGWRGILYRWDAPWYAHVALHGYSFDPNGESALAFFPLLPALLRALTWIGIDPALGGLLVANTCLLGAMVLLFRLTLREFGRRGLAETVVTLLAFAPGTLWLSLGYTESLLLVLLLGAILAARSGRIGVTLGLGVLAGLTRANALIVAVPLAVLLAPAAWRALCERRWWPACTLLLAACGPVIGHVLYLGYLQIAFGDWHALHTTTLKGWGVGLAFTAKAVLQKIPGFYLHVFDRPSIITESVRWWWLMVLAAGALSAIALWERRAPRWHLALLAAFFGLHVFVLQAGGFLIPIVRYATPIVPLYVGLALFAEERAWARPALLALSVAVMLTQAVQFFGGYLVN